MPSLVIADDHAIFRQGLAGLLCQEPDIRLLGEAADGEQLLELLVKHQPDLAVVDISMPGPGVADICQSIQQEKWPTKVIVLTMHQSIEMARHMLECGASAYVLKKNAFDDLRHALRNVAAGSTFVSPALASEMLDAPKQGKSNLTSREREVVRLVADGHTNQRIASLLSISIKTVQTHRARAMEKLQVHSAAELVKKAVSLGMIS